MRQLKFGIGQPHLRVEDPPLVQGKGKFVSDLIPDGALRSVFVRQLQWRQITYEVQSRTEVRMLSYRPMQPAIDSRVTEVSI